MLWLMEKTFFDESVKNDTTTYHNIQKIETAQGDDNITGHLLGYVNLKIF